MKLGVYAAIDHTRERTRPRSVVFKSKKDYNRQVSRKETRRLYNDYKEEKEK